MPKLITIPSTPGFTSSQFVLERAIGVTVSPFTGKQRTQEYDMAAWSGQVTLPPMTRAQAANWQSFLANLNGTVNYFHFGDPDGDTPRGTYSQGTLTGNIRVNGGTNVTSATLTFSGGNNIACTSAIFSGLVAGDFITVTGAINSENSGTFKITSVNSTSDVDVDAVLTTEASTSGCKVRQNVKGSSALSLQATTNSATGTIKAGDYLAICDGFTTDNRVQYVMVTEDATETDEGSGATNHYSVPIQPKLRADLTNGYRVGFASEYNKSRFRLVDNNIQWSANRLSVYGISFSFVEVIDG